MTKLRGETLTQRQTNALYRETHPDPQKLGDPTKKYKDAARSVLKELKDTGAPNLVVRAFELFGPDLMGSLAFALDLGAPFQRGSQLITFPNRWKYNPVRQLPLSYHDKVEIRHYRNYFFDSDIPTTEYFVEEGTFSDTFNENLTVGIAGGYRGDTTIKSRGPESPFGYLDLKLLDLDIIGSQDIHIIQSDKYFFQGGQLYDRFETIRRRVYDGPCVFFDDTTIANYVVGGLDTVYNYDAQNDFPGILRKCLLDRPSYNLFYQIAELKDVPMMLQKTHDMVEFLRKVCQDPKLAVMTADKAFSSAYINKLFGYDSLDSAIQSVLKLPQKAAKRLNYLLSRSGKPTNERSGKKYPARSRRSFLPPMTYWLPDWSTLIHDAQWATEWSEAKCVVNQTPTFPKSAVPEFSDSNFRDLLGVNPRIIDFYNLIPWSWFLDWFIGLGDYIDCVAALQSDKLFVNYGFFTYKGSAQIGHDFSARVTDTENVYIDNSEFGHPNPTMAQVYNLEVDDRYDLLSSGELRQRVFHGGYRWNGKFHTRVDISEMFGVKAASNYNESLSSSQLQIILALGTSKVR